jgi:predicted permease
MRERFRFTALGPEDDRIPPQKNAPRTRPSAMNQLLQDIRRSVRALIKQPGFTATALGTLALCIGANVAIFAVVDAIVFRPLPFPESERLVSVFNAYPKAGVERSASSVANYYDRRGAIKAFESVSAYYEDSVITGDAGSPRRVPIARVTPEFFSTLRVPLAKGKAFTDAEMSYGPDLVAVLTDAFWRSEFNADPNVLGRTLLSNGTVVTVIGVLPKNFRFLSSKAQFFRPASHEPEQKGPDSRHNNNWQMIARLAPGATVTQAQAQMDAFNAQQLADDPLAARIREAGYHTSVQSLHGDHVRTVKPILVLLQCGVAFLLVIGAVNLANLLLIRASGRSKDLAVRQALGASRWHVGQEVAVEILLLVFSGALLGLGLGAIGIRLLAMLGTQQLPLGADIQFDARVAAVSLGGAVLVGALLAVPVIWFNLHARLAPTLQMETRGGTAGPAAHRVRHAFIVMQVALAFVLLSSAGLLGLNLKKLLETPAGFRAENVLTARVSLTMWKNYQAAGSRLTFVERALTALGAQPGVSHVAFVSGLPFFGGTNDSVVVVEGQKIGPEAALHAHYQVAATGDYWATMGIPLLRGRLLEDADAQEGKARVCLVDQAFANFYWPGTDPVGKRLTRGAAFKAEEAFTVVGVVADVKQKELAEKAGHGALYFPYNNANLLAVVVRTAMPTAAFAETLRKTVLQIDPELPIEDVRPMQARVDESLIARRSPAILAAIFAVVALLLAALGTYGVLAYAVSQRRREIGVRMALGALPRQVLIQFLRLGSKLLLGGIALGVSGSWGAGWLMQNVLLDAGSARTEIFLLTAAVLGAVVLIACFLPSRRAARVSPMEALRAD